MAYQKTRVYAPGEFSIFVDDGFQLDAPMESVPDGVQASKTTLFLMTKDQQTVFEIFALQNELVVVQYEREPEAVDAQAN